MDRHTLWVKTDDNKRKLVLKYELKRVILKSLRVNKQATLANRVVASFQLIRMRKLNSKSFSKNRCLFSGRSKAIDNHTGLSRFYFRSEAYVGSIPGLRRASW